MCFFIPTPLTACCEHGNVMTLFDATKVFDAILLIFEQVWKCHEFIDLLAIQVTVTNWDIFWVQLLGTVILKNGIIFCSLILVFWTYLWSLLIQFPNFVSTVNHVHVTVCVFRYPIKSKFVATEAGYRVLKFPMSQQGYE